MRKAIAMIELIFALVIMGIVLMSAPMLISTATQSSYVAIQQESINEAATQLNIMLGYPWDEQNTDPNIRPIILGTTLGDAGLVEKNTSMYGNGVRWGTPATSYRRFIRSDGTRANATNIGPDGGDLDDLDDFDGSTVHLQEAQQSTADYIETTTIDITRNVFYTSDIPTGNYITDGNLTFSFNSTSSLVGNSSNIKRLQVTLTSTSGVDELEKTIVLHAFSCNIGSYELEESQ